MEIIDTLRQLKVGPFAVFDIALAYGGIFLVAPLLSKLFAKFHLDISRSAWLWLTVPIAVLFHAVFKQHTPLMKMLFNPYDFYLVKFIVLLMLGMGLRNVRFVKKYKIVS